MNLDNVRAYFNRAKILDAHIAARMESIRRLQALAEGCTSVYGEHIRGGGTVDRRMDIVARIADAKDDLQAELNQLLAVQNEIRAVIHSIPDETNQTCLELYYLANMTIEQTAQTMHYTQRNVYNILVRAMKQAHDFNPDIFSEEDPK